MATYWENSCSFGLRYVSWYKYLIVGLVFSHLGFWSGNLFLIAPFPDLCLLVPFQVLPGIHISLTGLVGWLYSEACPDMTLGVDCDVKHQFKQFCPDIKVPAHNRINPRERVLQYI